MYLIEDVLVSKELFSNHFECNLKACKGACCWEGDWGAPLEKEEIQTLTNIREALRPFVSEEGNEVLDEQGTSKYYKEPEMTGTPLLPDGTCAYVVFDEHKIAQCGIERAHARGSSPIPKPISCHLYPVRYSEIAEVSFKALNYEVWDICKAACDRGRAINTPVFTFVKPALIRKFGTSFYEKLHSIYQDLNRQDG